MKEELLEECDFSCVDPVMCWSSALVRVVIGVLPQWCCSSEVFTHCTSKRWYWWCYWCSVALMQLVQWNWGSIEVCVEDSWMVTYKRIVCFLYQKQIFMRCLLHLKQYTLYIRKMNIFELLFLSLPKWYTFCQLKVKGSRKIDFRQPELL